MSAGNLKYVLVQYVYIIFAFRWFWFGIAAVHYSQLHKVRKGRLQTKRGNGRTAAAEAVSAATTGATAPRVPTGA